LTRKPLGLLVARLIGYDAQAKPTLHEDIVAPIAEAP
jgi:hypothetical protein